MESTEEADEAGVVEIAACILRAGDSAKSGNRVGDSGKRGCLVADTAVAEGAWV